MNLESILLLTVVLSCTVTIVRALRLSWRRYADWLAAALVVLLFTGVVTLFAPARAAVLAVLAWALGMALPSVLARLTMSLVVRRRFRAAVWVARAMALLHPSRRWRRQPRLFRALAIAQTGDLDRAAQVLDDFADGDSVYESLATTQLMRLRNDWAGLRHWLEDRGEGIEPQLLPLYLRALGETGDLPQLVTAFTATELRARDQMGTLQWYSCVMLLLAFGGRPETLRRLFATKLHAYPEPVQEFWLATAEIAAGGNDQRLRDLAARRDGLDPLLQAGIARRLEEPLPPANDIMPWLGEQVVGKVEAELGQIERYGDRLLVHARRARVTWALVAVNVAVFALAVYLGGSTDFGVLDRLGTLVFDRVMEDHQYWRLITANFLHFGAVHLVMNMLGLALLGPFVEHALGRWRYLLLYLVGGVAAMGTVLLLAILRGAWVPGGDEVQGVLGASGCVMALVGATGTILWRGWRRERSGMLTRRLVFVGLILVLQVILDAMTPEVSSTAHLAGAVYGAVLGLVFRLRI